MGASFTKPHKKILFISHEASLTGAPLVLFNLLQWLSQNKNWELDVLFLKDGKRLSDFRSVCKTVYVIPEEQPWQRWYVHLYHKMLLKIGNKRRSKKDILLDRLVSNGYDLLYCNSVVSLEMGVLLKERMKCKMLLHLHEMEIIIRLFCQDFLKFSSFVDRFIAVSNSVSDMLKTRYAITDEKIETVYEFVSETPILKNPRTNDSNHFVIGGSGVVHWRKGVEFFILVADQVRKLAPNKDVEFVWVGNFVGFDKEILSFDLAKIGLQDIVRFVGETKEPFNYYNQFDLFLMTSREDPCPLVCIEVAMMGIPIICFQQAGGTEEWIPQEAVVPYLDVFAMAKAVVDRIIDIEKCKKESEYLQVKSQLFTTSQQAPKIASLISSL